MVNFVTSITIIIQVFLFTTHGSKSIVAFAKLRAKKEKKKKRKNIGRDQQYRTRYYNREAMKGKWKGREKRMRGEKTVRGEKTLRGEKKRFGETKTERENKKKLHEWSERGKKIRTQTKEGKDGNDNRMTKTIGAGDL
jgi:hypothetical protein